MSDGPRYCPHCGWELRPPTQIEKAMNEEAGVVRYNAEPQQTPVPPGRS